MIGRATISWTDFRIDILAVQTNKGYGMIQSSEPRCVRVARRGMLASIEGMEDLLSHFNEMTRAPSFLLPWHTYRAKARCPVDRDPNQPHHCPFPLSDTSAF